MAAQKKPRRSCLRLTAFRLPTPAEPANPWKEKFAAVERFIEEARRIDETISEGKRPDSPYRRMPADPIADAEAFLNCLIVVGPNDKAWSEFARGTHDEKLLDRVYQVALQRQRAISELATRAEAAAANLKKYAALRGALADEDLLEGT